MGIATVKVLLIALPTFGMWTPLNLLYLAGMLENHGIDCTIVDWNTEGCSGVIKEICKKYDIVGLSVLTSTRWNSFDTAALIREYSPESLIVMGGVHATLMPEQCQKYCDVVIKGDGEAPFLDLCQGKKPLERFLPINSLPIPAYHKIDLSKYPGRGYSKYDFRKANGVNIHGVPRVSMQATRSCTSHCRFCSSPKVQGEYRMRDPCRVVGEMGYLYVRYGIRHFYFNDDSFYLDRDRGIEFCELVARKLKVAFHIETRADVLDLEYAIALKRAGCYRVQVGLETGSPEVLGRMSKSIDLDAIRDGIQNCKKAGLRVDANLIVGNEGETDETIEQTRKFLKNANPTTISSTWNGLLLFPGTAVYRKAIKEGLITDDFWETREECKVYKFSPEQIGQWNHRVYTYKFIPRLRYWAQLFENKVCKTGFLNEKKRHQELFSN